MNKVEELKELEKLKAQRAKYQKDFNDLYRTKLIMDNGKIYEFSYHDYVMSKRKTDIKTPAIMEELGKRFKRVPQLMAKLSGLSKKILELHRKLGIEDEEDNILDEYKEEIIFFLAYPHSIAETINWLYSFKNVKTNKSHLNHFIKKHKKEIEEVVKREEKNFKDIPLTVKKRRLLELQELWDVRKELHTEKPTYHNLNAMLNVMKSIQSEVLENTLNVNVNVNEVLQVQLFKEEGKTVSVQMLAIAKVAGRLGINPEYFMAKLENSYYSKYNIVVSPLEKIKESYEKIFPNDASYDFENIEVKTKEKQKEEIKLLEKYQMKNENSGSNLNDLKEKLLERLKNM